MGRSWGGSPARQRGRRQVSAATLAWSHAGRQGPGMHVEFQLGTNSTMYFKQPLFPAAAATPTNENPLRINQ